MSQYKLAASRPQGTANVRVFTPTVAEHGWSAGGHTVVEVVTDDMPFLVDSVTMELTEQNRDVHMVVHPQILVRRDITGDAAGGPRRRRRWPAGADLPHDVFRESWMHVEIDRETDAASSSSAIEQALSKVLLDVREAVEDWQQDARPGRVRSSTTSTSTRRRCPPRRSRRARRCSSGWPTTTSPSSATASTASRTGRR